MALSYTLRLQKYLDERIAKAGEHITDTSDLQLLKVTPLFMVSFPPVHETSKSAFRTGLH